MVALKKLGMPRHVIVPMCILYCAREVTVGTEYGETERFPIGKGVRQECILPPYLFNPHAEHTRKTGLESEE